MEWVFQKKIDLVAERGGRFLNRANGQLEHRGSRDADWGNAPGFQPLFKVDNNSVAVKVDGVDREAHGEGVDAMGGTDPEPASPRKMGRVSGHEAAEA